MKKFVSILLTIALITPTAQSFAATPKAGAACKKLNEVQVVKNLKFTCIQKGSKLVWNNGEKTSTDPTAQLSNYEKTKLKAYNAIRAEADKGNLNNVNLKYFISASFPTDLKNLYTQQVEYASKLYGSFFTKKELINIFMYTEKDTDKIQADPLLNNEYSNLENWFKRWDQGIDRQHNLGLAASYIQRNDVWQGFAGLVVYSGSTNNSLRPYAIQVMPHEYWHIVQDYYMQKGRGTLFSDSKSYDTRFPPTFREGSANTISFAIATNKFNDYLALYKNFIAEKNAQTDITIFKSLKTEAAVIKALNQIEFREGNPQGFEASYSVGQLLYEWVIAEYGFDGYRKIIQNQLVGSSFDDNLKQSIGISKDQLYTKAAPHILAAFNQ